MKATKLVIFLLAAAGFSLSAQSDSSSVQQAAYQRPFISIGRTSTAVGGYLEGNTNYFQEDGVSDGFTMEMRRFNIFLYSTISHRVRFLSELEFEHGTEEIALETAQIDIEFDPALVFRAGIIVVPIGAFNQNHDSPKWEFVERPLVSTEVIPSTLSEIGFGVNGKRFMGTLLTTYDLYMVNGLTDNIILNEEGRTFLQSGKSEERFAEDNNGAPTLTGRLGIQHFDIGEFGLSFYTGAYNRYKREGEPVAEKRNVSIYAVDFDAAIADLKIRGEIALAKIEVPKDISEIFGGKQWGGYIEFLYPALKLNAFGFANAVINTAVRFERVDYNVGRFADTNRNIFDDINAVALALSFRPSSNTVLRANYRHHWIRDFAGNPTMRSAGFQFGIASYF